MSYPQRMLNKALLLSLQSMKRKLSFFQRILRRIVGTSFPRMEYQIKNASGEPISGTRISSHTFIDHPENLKLGNQVYIGHFNVIEASQGIMIDEGVQITAHCVLTTHSSHQSIRLYGRQYSGAEMYGYKKGGIEIGKFTFVGPHSTIMPNTIIGKGCLIHAYSYVRGTYPDYSVIGGNPAIVLGDTRTLDQPYLDEHPELKAHYEAWTSE